MGSKRGGCAPGEVGRVSQRSTPELWGSASSPDLRTVSDTSLHLCLPAERGQELAKLGWGQPHQYEDFGTEFLIYGPRTTSEVDAVVSIIEESLVFARQSPR
ncbi:luciferase domain-containing protein [Salinibacterium sp. NYA9b]